MHKVNDPCGRFVAGRPVSASRWRLAQSHQTVAQQVQTIAESAVGAGDATAWSARVLAWAQQHGLADVVTAARVAALETNSTQVGDLRGLATAWNAAQAASARNTAMQLSPVESARSAYNTPSHWLLLGNGTLAVDAGALHDAAAAAWQGLTAKFGEGLAQRLFNACVRGDVSSLIKLLDLERSLLTLTLRDVTRLQHVAVTNGVNDPIGVSPTLHDTMHVFGGYGVSLMEETLGDQFAEFLAWDFYNLFPDVLNPNLPLGRQPQGVERLQSLVDHRQAITEPNSTGELRLRDQVGAVFYDVIPAEIFIANLLHDWTGKSAAQNASFVEDTLRANGVLAHLSPSAEARVLSLVYGASRAGTFENLNSQTDPTTDPQGFKRAFVSWVRYDFSRAVVEESSPAWISKEVFNSKAANVLAAVLMLERVAPDTLALAPFGTALSLAERSPALLELDVRRAYPQVRHEVRRALGLPF